MSLALKSTRELERGRAGLILLPPLYCSGRGCKHKASVLKKLGDFWVAQCAECERKGFVIDMDKCYTEKELLQ